VVSLNENNAITLNGMMKNSSNQTDGKEIRASSLFFVFNFEFRAG
jgi:hypothetical protein